ncbi:MAG: hypothetical protein IPH50_02720 [Rhodanobacteraceae bacterium]|nr:hypothetical protein [Rhodanobacteraceae bacterium]
MVRILREADKHPVAEVAKSTASATTLYVWRKRRPARSCRWKQLRALQAENTRLKKLLAEQHLMNEIRRNQRKMVSVPARREQVMYAHRRGLSLAKSCTLLSVSRSALRYESRMDAKDAPVIEARRYSAQFPFGYRRINIYLEREGVRARIGSGDRTTRPQRRSAGVGHAAANHQR